MKDDEYYVIHRSVLPDYFENVLEYLRKNNAEI